MGSSRDSGRPSRTQVIEGRIYQSLADLRKALANFMDLYNRAWRLEKLGGRTPDEARQAWVTGASGLMLISGLNNRARYKKPCQIILCL